MKQNCSALMDGELDHADEEALFAQLRQDETLQETWLHYHLIGDAMRQDSTLSIDISKRVRIALMAEPTILAPNPLRGTRRKRQRVAVVAMAASVSFVAVVGWMQLGRPIAPSVVESSVLAQVNTTRSSPARSSRFVNVAPVLNASQIDLHDEIEPYLIAHQQISAQSTLQTASLITGGRGR